MVETIIIDFNTENRRQAANDFEKDLLKLMKSALFGKTMENLRKHVNVKLVNDEMKALFSQDLSAIQMKRPSLNLKYAKGK